MRFSLKQTSARAFDLYLPDEEDRVRKLGFEHITELGGAIEIVPHAIVLEEAAARLAQITAVEWRTETGLITTGAPVSVMELFVDGRIPRGDAAAMPLDGRATLKRLSTESLVVEGFGPRIATGVRIERLDLAQHEPSGTATAESIALSELETAVGDFVVRLREAVAGGIHARWPIGSAERDTGLEITAASVTGTGLAMRSRALDIQAEDIDVRDVAARGRAYSLASVAVGKLSLGVDLTAFGAAEAVPSGDAAPAAEPASEPAAAPARDSIRSQIDWRFLDRVDGQIDVDVTVDAHLPVIRRRRATHYFRVPIEKGILNYRQLESGLASLENAVIDFDVRGHKLVIERDLPIIRMRKNLVEWHLDDEEMALAKQHKVKLHTLPRFEISSTPSKNSDLKLHRIEIHPINVDLSVAPPAGDGEAAEGAGEGAGRAQARPEPAAGPQRYDGILPELALRRLTATGALDFPEGEGALTLKIKQLAAALSGVPLGDFVLDVGAIRVDSIDPIKIIFDGLRPRALSLTMHGLELERVTLTRVAADAHAIDRADENAPGDAGQAASTAQAASAAQAAAPAGPDAGDQ